MYTSTGKVHGVTHLMEHPMDNGLLVVEGIESGDFGLETLADTDTPDEVLEFRTLLERG